MKILIFGTAYVDTVEKQSLLSQWWRLHSALNSDCDLLIVDSNSPLSLTDNVPVSTNTLQCGNNIGHLSRGGKDGWGRAFCVGLQYAIDEGYDYVVHIEGDSLCRIDVTDTCRNMQRDELVCVSVPVRGLKKPEYQWVETGLMFFDVNYVRDSKLIDRYDWTDCGAKRYPNTPEHVLHNLIGTDLRYGNWRTVRDDNKIAGAVRYDWITHARPHVYDAFFKNNMPKVPA